MSNIFNLDFPYPYLTTTYEDIKAGILYKNEQNYTHVNKVSQGFNKKLGLVVIKLGDVQASSDYTGKYSLCERVRAKRHDTECSVYEYWNNNKKEVIDKSILALKTWKGKHDNEEMNLIDQCADTLFRIGIPASFPTSVMICLLDKEKDLKILDISSGWGDRLLGACKLDAIYTGCDPNTVLTKCYDRIIEEHGSKEKHKVYCVPFEDWEMDDKKYNVLFTSPPFFNLEFYTNEETQSIMRYKTINDWLYKFLFVCLEKANKSLEKNAKIYLHLSDVINFKDNKKSIIYMQKVIEYCVNVLSWKYIGNYGYTISDESYTTETQDELNEKNKCKINIRKNIKLYKNNIRCDKEGKYLAQIIWHFTK